MSNLRPKEKPNIPVNCAACGHEHSQDPPFFVECPKCRANPGTYCKRPSGHQGPFVDFHAERDVLALKLGYYDHPNMGSYCGPHSQSERAKEIVAKYLPHDNCVNTFSPIKTSREPESTQVTLF